MNYRQFFKNKKPSAKDIQCLIPEGVDQKQFDMGIKVEKEHTDDEFTAAKIAGDHLGEDPEYYTKLSAAGLEEEGQEQEECGMQDEHCGACEDDVGDEYDDNGGLPKIGGVLNVPHLGDPIRMAKIISVGPIGKGPASGELSGYSNVGGGKGVTKDQGGVPANQSGDKEPITAGGHKPDNSIATKSVGGSVVPGEGQKQGGPNSQGTIADTAKLDESKQKVRKIVKDVLKEITFNKKSGKWVRLNEGGHKAGCTCGFCKNKGTFGKKKKKEDKEDKSEEMDETVDMKMGTSYKTVQPRMYDIQSDDRARTNQYDPEITEMYDDEEECMTEQRYTELANAPRNLNETEIAEMKTLREKIDRMQMAKRNYGLSQGGVEPNIYEDNGMEHPDDARERAEFQRGINQYNKRNPQRYPCPTCKTPNALSADQKKRGYQCNACANAEEGPMGGGESGFGGEYQNENTVNMKMGPSYKVVSPQQARCQKCDQARTVQYEPEMTEEITDKNAPQVAALARDSHDALIKLRKQYFDYYMGVNPNADRDKMERVATYHAKQDIDNYWKRHGKDPSMGYHVTKPSTSPEVNADRESKMADRMAKAAAQHADAYGGGVDFKFSRGEHGINLANDYKPRQPSGKYSGVKRENVEPSGDMKLTEEEIQALMKEEEPVEEAGTGAVQHSSYRTVDHGNLPQKPKQRWADDLDEVTKKVSKAVKTIQKGQKAKKTKKNPKLKFQPTKHTTSGVHKRKT